MEWEFSAHSWLQTAWKGRLLFLCEHLFHPPSSIHTLLNANTQQIHIPPPKIPLRELLSAIPKSKSPFSHTRTHAPPTARQTQTLLLKAEAERMTPGRSDTHSEEALLLQKLFFCKLMSFSWSLNVHISPPTTSLYCSCASEWPLHPLCQWLLMLLRCFFSGILYSVLACSHQLTQEGKEERMKPIQTHNSRILFCPTNIHPSTLLYSSPAGLKTFLLAFFYSAFKLAWRLFFTCL